MYVFVKQSKNTKYIQKNNEKEKKLLTLISEKANTYKF